MLVILCITTKTMFATTTLAALPEILQDNFKESHQYESCPISFEVTAQGIPKPEATWLHDGKPLKADGRIKIIEQGDLYKLDITEVKLDDKGEYKVIVKNQLGEQQRQGVLSVSRKFSHRSKIYGTTETNIFI